jgi:hypothetical protein
MCAICETQKGFDPMDNMRRGRISTTYSATIYYTSAYLIH